MLSVVRVNHALLNDVGQNGRIVGAISLQELVHHIIKLLVVSLFNRLEKQKKTIKPGIFVIEVLTDYSTCS